MLLGVLVATFTHIGSTMMERKDPNHDALIAGLIGAIVGLATMGV